METPEDIYVDEPRCLAGVGDVIAGKYEVERVLGEGGMGIVVAAMHVELQERVAIKLMLPSLVGHSESAARFVREARATFGIKSEHVARLLDFGKLEDGAPFMVMEYLEGQTLAALLDQEERIAPTRAIDMVIEACAGVADAHRLGIIHRDLKPENLFLAVGADDRVVVKVLDFGISKADLKNLAPTRTEGGMGTPAYAAPEQLRCAGDAGPGADIWSLGVVLFELLTGRLPFRAQSFAEMCAAVLTQRPPMPRSIRPSIPEGLEAIVMRCLEMEPGRRYPTVNDLVVALASYASDDGRAAAARVDPRSTGTHRLPAFFSPAPATRPLGFRHDEDGSLSGCERDTEPHATPAPGAAAAALRTSRIPPVARRATLIAAATCALIVLVGGVLGKGGDSGDTDAVALAATAEGSSLSVHAASPSGHAGQPAAGAAGAVGPDGVTDHGASAADRGSQDVAAESSPAGTPSAAPAGSASAAARGAATGPRATPTTAARAAAVYRGFGGRK